MLFDFHIDPSLDIPIYVQLTDMLRAQIRAGNIAYEEKLPTVRELSDRCGIALGTVMRAYGELERTGYIRKATGKGTFACWREDGPASRKEAAIAAIDRMLDELEKLRFSPAETAIYLDLKLRERGDESRPVRIAVVDANEELLYRITARIGANRNVSVSAFRLQDIMDYPYRIDDTMDLIVTRRKYCDTLMEKLPDTERLLPVAVRMLPETVNEICRIGRKHRVLLACMSERFGRLISRDLEEYFGLLLSDIALFDDLTEERLQKADTVLVPESYEMFCSAETEKRISGYGLSHKLIRCAYALDEGSMIALEDRISRIIKARNE